MIIQNSAVYMGGSSRFMSRQAIGSERLLGWGDVLSAGQSAITSPAAKESEQKSEITKEKFTAQEAYANASEVKNGIWHETAFEPPEQVKQEYSSLENALALTTAPKQILVSKVSTYELFMKLLGNLKERLYDQFQCLGRGSRTNTYYTLSSISPTQSIGDISSLRLKTETVSRYADYYEEAEMFYQTAGRVQTSDGRSIDFDVNLFMTRSFEEHTEMKVSYSSYELVDPLVISLSGEGAEVTDQTFLFDIDMDGELDNISLLAETCGFLSWDKNGDGIINDGSELFGTESGDGFRDLAVFDLDGNGWIDENDEVFNHLRIWTRDAAGNDKLVALGIAGIGAIYLGSLNTDFSMKDEANGLQAHIDRNGVYLKENGEAGIIQNVSMAIRDGEENAGIYA